MPSATLQAYVDTAQSIHSEALIWIIAQDFTTGAPVTFGFWTGDDHETILVGGTPRLYYGAGTLPDIEREPLVFEMGLDVQTWQFDVNMAAIEVETMVRGYNLNLAEVQVHRAVFDPETRALIDPPERRFRGRIEGAPITESTSGEIQCTIQVVSDSANLTLTRPETRSDATYRAIRDGDRIFRHVDVTRTAKEGNKWGS